MTRISLLLSALLFCCAGLLSAQDLVLLHTNDTHSHIDADHGKGGVLQRKALIDSIRRAEKNVVLIDAGDIVQGSLYFKLFGGQVEYPLMDMIGYDIQILGNHEFDNGVNALAKHYKRSGSAKLSANYDFSSTPLAGVFDPFIIKKIGGKKVGFFGLNLDPTGIVSEDNYRGIVYSDIIETANSTAAKLRSMGCELVVAVTHIGYSDDSDSPKTTDVDLARASKGIDIIISGHSHEVVSPDAATAQHLFLNAVDKPVLIAQTGRYGSNLGYIKVSLSGDTPHISQAAMIPVQGIDSARFDRKLMRYLAPYRHIVDSINAHQIAICNLNMLNTKQYAISTPLSNFTADAVHQYACHVADSLGTIGKIDLSVINSGGIRLPMDSGAVTEGQILSMYPFINYVEILEFSGIDLQAALTQAALQKGQAVSNGVWITLNEDGTAVSSILINGEPIDPSATYRMATLDYLAGGGDYLSEFKKGHTLWRDTRELCAPIMAHVVALGRAGVPINPDPRPRIVKGKKLPQ